MAKMKMSEASGNTRHSPPPKQETNSNDFFWELAGMFGWEGRKIEDIEITMKLKTDKPVEIVVQYKDHGREKFNGDTETTSEFALVLEKYNLILVEKDDEPVH